MSNLVEQIKSEQEALYVKYQEESLEEVKKMILEGTAVLNSAISKIVVPEEEDLSALSPEARAIRKLIAEGDFGCQKDRIIELFSLVKGEKIPKLNKVRHNRESIGDVDFSLAVTAFASVETYHSTTLVDNVFLVLKRGYATTYLTLCGDVVADLSCSYPTELDMMRLVTEEEINTAISSYLSLLKGTPLLLGLKSDNSNIYQIALDAGVCDNRTSGLELGEEMCCDSSDGVTPMNEVPSGRIGMSS